MQIAQIVAGYTLGGADLLRRAMGKKNAEAMAKERSQFVDGAVAHGTPKAKATEIFDLMEKFAEYGFNKSHSAAYALISYHTAFLKTHYKVEFMAALLTSEIGNQDKILKYIAACRDMDIEVRKPTVQLSRREFIVRDGSVVYGMGGIKNVGDEAIREIVEAREANGPFASFLDLCSRVNLRKVTKRVLESLIKGGACDDFGCARAGMLAALDVVVARAQKKIKERQSNQISLLALAPVAVEEKQIGGIGFACAEQEAPEWDEEQKLRFEKEALGFFLTSHPLQPYHQELGRLGLVQLEDARDMADKATIKCAVLVTTMREILNKRGNRMAFVNVEDLTASAEVTFFTEELAAARELLASEQPLLLTAVIDSREGASGTQENGDSGDEGDEPPVREIKLRAISVQSLAEASQASDAPLSYEIDPSRLAETGLLELKAILESHKGHTEVQLTFLLDGVHCRIRLGPQWRVTPGPAFQQDMHRWGGRPAQDSLPDASDVGYVA